MGGDHPTVANFDDIRYGLMMWTESTPDSAWDKARAGGVKRAIAVIEGAIHLLTGDAETRTERRAPGRLSQPGRSA